LPMKSVANADPVMTPEERAYVTQLLKDSLTEYLSHIESVSEAQWIRKSAPDRWSIGETAEHIMLNEAFLFGVVQRALQSPVDPDWQSNTAGKSDLLERLMPDRSRKVNSPEPVNPKGLSKEDVTRKFKQSRAQTLHFAETTQLPLKAHTREHPFPIFGRLNAYQWLLYIPLHNKRHNQQIAVALRT
jgi:DinB superfamily